MSKWYKIVHIPTLKTLVEWPLYLDERLLEVAGLRPSDIKYSNDASIGSFHLIMFRTKTAAKKYLYYFKYYGNESFWEDNDIFMTVDEQESDVKLPGGYNINEFMIVEVEDV